MTEEIANQTVYVRESTKKTLMHLASWLPPSDAQVGRRGKSTLDDAIRFLLERAGIDIMNTREAQVAVISRITEEVLAGECVALIGRDDGPPYCSRKGMTEAECEGCKIRG